MTTRYSFVIRAEDDRGEFVHYSSFEKLDSANKELYKAATDALNLLDRSLDSEPSKKDIMAVLEKLSAALAKARGEL